MAVMLMKIRGGYRPASCVAARWPLSPAARLAVVIAVVSSACTLSAETPTAVGSLVIKLIDQVEAPALEPGALSSLEVQVGDSIKAGELIAKIDDRDSLAQRALADTDLAISRQQSAEYRNDKIALAERDEKRAALEQQRLLARISKEKSGNEVRVLAAEKAEAVAKNEWTRAVNAHERFADSVSESELDSLRLKYERAQLERIQAKFERRMETLSSESEAQAVKVAELAAKRAELQQTVAESDGEILRLDVEAKKTTLQIRELSVARHQVLSPIDGVVVEIFKRRGEWVRPGDSVVRVINVEQLHAEGFLSGEVRPDRGQHVRLRSGDREVDGTVDFVSSERDSVSGEFRFLVRLSGGTFLPGDRVEIQW